MMKTVRENYFDAVVASRCLSKRKRLISVLAQPSSRYFVLFKQN
jgi:hypothetical protein